MGTDVTVTTSLDHQSKGSNGNNSSNGDITINKGITLTGGSDATLTLNAARHITLSSGVRYLDTGSGKLSLAFVAGGNITQNTGSNAAIHIAGSLSFTTTNYTVPGSSNSVSFTYSGSATTWTVPSGVNSITIDGSGGGGG